MISLIFLCPRSALATDGNAWNAGAGGWAMDYDLSGVNASFWAEPHAADYAGYNVAGVGDVNGDGIDDFVISSWGNDDGGDKAGQVYLILGKASGWAMDTSLSSADASFWGEHAGDQAAEVAGVGDVNGDGFDDFIIGACCNNDGGTKAGQVYLILGKASGWAMDTNLSSASASFWGEHAGDTAGLEIAGVGDVNHDGFDDFVIGAYANGDGGSSAGQTYLILGKASGWAMDTNLSASSASFWGEHISDYAGYTVAGVGDVNHDGFDDFVIGACGNDDGGNGAGQTYLILGKASGWAMDQHLSTVGVASASFWGEHASDSSSYALAGVGDVNHDGFDDFIIGAYGNSDGGSSAGQVYLILGKASGWAMDTRLSAANASFWGEHAGDQAGWTVAGAGDVNHDGFDDFIIGAPTNDDGGNNAGQVYLILGKASGWAMDTNLSASNASFWAENAGDYAGYGISLAGVGDVNHDGVDDFVIGSPYDDAAGGNAGQAYLIFGVANIVSNAGSDASNQPDATLYALSGTCTDINASDTLQGWWSQTAGTTCTLSGHITSAKASGSSSVAVSASCTPDVSSNETLTFRLTCDNGTVQEIDDKNVGINAAPVIDERSVVAEVACTKDTDCVLPDWSANDINGESVSTSWEKVSGTSDLHFTDGGDIDLIHYHPARGTYYIQMTASDGTSESISDLVKVIMPNNTPVLAEDVAIDGLTCKDNTCTASTFTKNVTMPVTVTDIDNDTLSYAWAISPTDNTITGSGAEATIELVTAGDITVTMAANDGHEGTLTKTITISEPAPEAVEDMNIAICSIDFAGTTQTVTIELNSIVKPIVKINGITAAEGGTCGGIANLAKANASSDYKSYIFKAENVPMGDDLSALNIDVAVNINGKEESLLTKTASVKKNEDQIGSGLDMTASAGCSIANDNTQSMMGIFCIFLGLISLLPLRIIKKRQRFDNCRK